MTYPLVVVGLTLLLAYSSAEELTCPDQQAQLATRVIQCFNHDPVGSTPPALPALPTSALPVVDRLHACFAASGQGLRAVTGLAPDDARSYLQPLLDQFARTSGIRNNMTYVPLADVMPELRSSIARNLSAIYDVFVSSSDANVELEGIGAYQDLAPFVNSDSSGAYGAVWQEIHPFFRTNLAIVAGKIISVPFATHIPYMYWRTDIFRRFNISKPDTWEEVLEVARFLNRTNWDPRVRKKIPICFPKPLIRNMGEPVYIGAYVLPSMLGSMTQYQGRLQGMLFDPLSMTPLVNNTAMAHALEMYAELANLMPDASPDGNPWDANTSPILSGGYCAFGFRWAGNLGMSILPGSTRVWDRVNNVMVDCTASLCHGSDAIVRQDPVTGDNVTRYVNRVSYGALPGYGASINAYADRGYQEAAYQALSSMAQALLASDTFIFSGLVPFGPIKTKQLTLDPASLAFWPKAYNQTDVRVFLSTTIDIIAHPNTLIDLKMPSQAEIKIIINDAARLVERDGTGAIPGIMAQTYKRFSDIASSYTPGGIEAFRAIYWQGLGFVPPSPPPRAANPPPPQPVQSPPADKSDTALGVAIGVSIPVGVSVIAVVVVAVLLRRRSKHRTLLGKVVPPELGPMTTLLVTDIQSSTSLWDSLPQDVMESSVALHYAVLRRVAHVNGGHESATEGDSIILGFHDPLSATRAAVQAQAELLAADWPKGLFNHPLCAPKYAVPVASIDEQATEQAGYPADALVSRALPQFPLWDSGALSASHRPGSDEEERPRQTGFKSSWKSCRWTLRTAWQACAFRAPPPTAPPAFSRSCSSPLSQDPLEAPAAGQLIGAANTQPTDRPSSSVAEFLSSLVQLSEQPHQDIDGSPLLYRGLRVRIGVHTGLLEESSVITNVRTGRLQYAGTALAIATAVSSAGHGGMVLLSEDTFAQMDGASLATKGLLLASMGSVQLMDVDAPAELYQALTQQLAYRVCFNAHLRYSQQLSPSFLDAPHDRMTVCFINAVGLAALNAWSSTITQSSIQVYQCVAATQLERHGGYLVNSSAGMFVAVFKDPARALRWALCTLQQCLEAEWHPALLEHELGEEVEVGHNVTEASDALMLDNGALQELEQRRSTVRMSADAHNSAMTHQSDHMAHSSSRHASSHASNASRRQGRIKTVTRKTVLFRGLRLKCAVDVGQAKASIEPSTGRVMYFGRTMNRCARVSAMTKTGQVWCTQDVWDLASPTINSYESRCLEAADWQDRASAKHTNAPPSAPPPGRHTPFPYADLMMCSRQASVVDPSRPHAAPALPSRTSPESGPAQPARLLADINLHDVLGAQLAPGSKATDSSEVGRSKTWEHENSPPQQPENALPKRPLWMSCDGVKGTSSATGDRKGPSENGFSDLPQADEMEPTVAREASALPMVSSSAIGVMLSGGGNSGRQQRPAPADARSPCSTVPLVTGMPLGQCKLRGIQESVSLVQCRFNQGLIQVTTQKVSGGGTSDARPDLIPTSWDAGAVAARASSANVNIQAAGVTQRVGRSVSFKTEAQPRARLPLEGPAGDLLPNLPMPPLLMKASLVQDGQPQPESPTGQS